MTLLIAFILLNEYGYPWWAYVITFILWCVHVNNQVTKSDVYNSFVEFYNDVRKMKRAKL